MDTKARFSKNIKKLRAKTNLTQEQFAEKLGLQSFQSISNLENGKNIASPETMDAICEVFDIDIAELFLSDVNDKKAKEKELMASITAMISTYDLKMLKRAYKVLNSLFD